MGIDTCTVHLETIPPPGAPSYHGLVVIDGGGVR